MQTNIAIVLQNLYFDNSLSTRFCLARFFCMSVCMFVCLSVLGSSTQFHVQFYYVHKKILLRIPSQWLYSYVT